MRLLLLLLLAALTAIAAPWLLFEARPDLLRDLLPEGASIRQAYADAPEIARHLFGFWRTGQEPVATEPVFTEPRLAGTATLAGVAALWFVTFMIGGLIGLILITVGNRTLLVVALLAGGLVVLVMRSGSLDASWEARRVLETVAVVALLAALTGFLATRLMRRATL